MATVEVIPLPEPKTPVAASDILINGENDTLSAGHDNNPLLNGSREPVAHIQDSTTPTTKQASNEARPSNIVHPSYPHSDLAIPDHHIDDVRSLRVVVIGAGLSGILAGVLLPAKVPGIKLTILDKNKDVVSSRNGKSLASTMLP